MAAHNKTGFEGEELAVSWLQSKGYTILHRNWRHSHYEIDIIATKNNMLKIIEVKCRRSDLYGLPEDSVTKKKFKHLKYAADEFLFQNPGYKWIQYDILSIILRTNKEPDFFLLEDVYM